MLSTYKEVRLQWTQTVSREGDEVNNITEQAPRFCNEPEGKGFARRFRRLRQRKPVCQ